MKAKSIKGNSIEETKNALEQSIADGYQPTLAFVFITNMGTAVPVAKVFDEDGISVFGISTSEKFTEDGMQQHDIVALLLDLDPACFKIVLKDFKECVPHECARQTGTIGLDAFDNPGFIISAADIKMGGEDLIDGLMETVGTEVSVMGGVAGNPVDFSGIVFTNNASTNSGLLTLIIDQDKIAISGLAVSGWKPAGTMKKITKSEGFWIQTIDDEPAMNVLQKFLGNEIINFNNAPQGLLPVDIGYPLQFQRKSGTPIMRPVLLWNTDDKSIMVGGQIKETENFRFSLPPDFDAIDTVIESTRMTKEKSMPDVDALLVFSCVGRLGSFGPMISAEIEGMAATWNKPMIGFFSLGEFGKLEDSQCEFHGTTVSWVALKEK